MKTETILAKHISYTAEMAAYDAVCKRLLANKVILAWIMKKCLDEYQEYEIQEIADRYIEGTPEIAQAVVNPDEETDTEQIKGMMTEDSTVGEGTITYDIRFYAIIPRSEKMLRLIINVEAQNDFYPGYPITKRGIYYGSRMISAQYGTEFTDSHYEKIKKVYSIWICMNPPEFRMNTMNRYAIKEELMWGSVKENIENYDLLAVIMICLGDTGKASPDIIKLLEVLLSSTRKAEEKKEILQNDFGIEMTKTLEREVSTMCNLSWGVAELALEKGMKQGIEQGILTSLKNLMETMNWSAEQVMSALKIPETEWGKYADELKKQKS